MRSLAALAIVTVSEMTVTTAAAQTAREVTLSRASQPSQAPKHACPGKFFHSAIVGVERQRFSIEGGFNSSLREKEDFRHSESQMPTLY